MPQRRCSNRASSLPRIGGRVVSWGSLVAFLLAAAGGLWEGSSGTPAPRGYLALVLLRFPRLLPLHGRFPGRALEEGGLGHRLRVARAWRAWCAHGPPRPRYGKSKRHGKIATEPFNITFS